MGKPVEKATMLTLAVGSSCRAASARGFTLLELLLVVALVAIVSAGISHSLPDERQVQLEVQAYRLAALLESARGASRLSGTPMQWQVTNDGFVWRGESPHSVDKLPTTWQISGISVDAVQPLVLGPEPVIAPQHVRLWLGTQPELGFYVGTDGVRPFSVSRNRP
jgi:general secretion pathway protein H